MKPFFARSGILVGATILLSGCCSNVTTDPRAGGLAGGVCGNVTGVYDQRVAGLEAEAGAFDDANARLRGRLGQQRAVARSLSAELSDRRARLASLDRTLKRKQAATGRSQADRRDLAALRRERAALTGEIAGLVRAAGERERPVMAMERGMRGARDERTRQRLAREKDRASDADLITEMRRLRQDETP